MKKTLKTLWIKFVNYLNAGSAGSHDGAAIGSYAGLCGLIHSEDHHH
ncbi:MAG TPA: hypothetical protein VNX00_00215 [Herbaspirillum sp.]|jgi:hypothetical protein|nr:hypothetical protein [Herbaspirillum sp.]